MSMNRRELLKMIAVVTGTTFIGGEYILTGCRSKNARTGGATFSAADIAFLDAVGETILPTTARSPGAKAAEIGKYMQVMVNDCYDADAQRVFHDGMTKLNNACEKLYGINFMEAALEQKRDLLVIIDGEAKEFECQRKEFNTMGRQKERKPAAHYFTMMKQLTLHGFFTSKIGSTLALRHVAIPTYYEGCIPYKKGDRAWAVS